MDLMVELKSTKSGFAIRRLDHFGINQDKFWSAAQESNLYGFPQNFLRVPRLPIPANRRWSEIKESNLYGLPHQFLKLTRLPVPANLRLKWKARPDSNWDWIVRSDQSCSLDHAPVKIGDPGRIRTDFCMG